jgi:hypothetical protein
LSKHQTKVEQQYSPRRLYALLKAELDLSLRQLGFIRINTCPLTYSYVDTVEELTLWFEAEDSNWDPLWGSAFTMELERVPHEFEKKFRRETRAKFSALLDRDDLEELRAMNNEVIAALPGTTRDAAIYLVDTASGQDVVFAGVRAQKTPYGLGWNVWMRYLDSDHIVAWADFLRPRLPALVAKVRRLLLTRNRIVVMHDHTEVLPPVH